LVLAVPAAATDGPERRLSVDFEVTLDELRKKIDRKEHFYLVEAQSPMMYDDAHLPGALNLPPSQVAEMASSTLPEKNAEIVVYCSGPT
jgi:rhodanese-related sulfurtransferase